MTDSAWRMASPTPRARRSIAMAALCAPAVLITAGVAAAPSPEMPPGAPPLAFGVDRSNMATQWTLSWPQEPKVSPFLSADYNKPGNFEARRVAVMDGIARIHAGWFRDGFGKGSPDLFVDLVKLVHGRGMKLLAVFGAAASDYPQGAYLSKEQSGCQWGTYPLSKINLAAYQKRIETQFAAVRAAGETVDAFEIGNELDLYCNDADNPTSADWAKHQWKWFLSDAQAQTFVRGADGKIADYTRLVDGYGSHLYPTSTTTLNMVQDATNSLRYEAAHYPQVGQKPIWITEWNPAARAGGTASPGIFSMMHTASPAAI